MKKISFLAAFSITALTTLAQTPHWEWAKTADAGAGSSYSVATDKNGFVYITGVFSTSITIGSTTVSSNTYIENVLTAKFDSLGNSIWVNSAGCDYGTGLRTCTDEVGSVYTAGNFYSKTIHFGSTILHNLDTTSQYPDIFIGKYNTTGHLLWAKRLGGINDEYIGNITTDKDKNLYLMGSFDSPSITLDNITLTKSVGGQSIFIVKFDSTGKVLWAKNGIGNNSGVDMNVDGAGNAYICGGYSSSSLSFDSITITSASGSAFLAKFDSAGKVLFLKNSSVTGGNNKMRIDTKGNLYITGTATPYKATTTKMNANGNLLWSQSAIGHAFGNGVGFDKNGNAYVTGYFLNRTITFGNITLNNADTSGKTGDVFVAKYDSSGYIAWAVSVGGLNTDQGEDITTDAVGNVYVTGNYLSPSITFGSTTLSSVISGNFFLAKIGSDISTRINKEFKKGNLLIYPNPSSNIFHLLMDGNQKGDVLIYDVAGSVVYWLVINSSTPKIDLSDVPPGIYFLQLINDDGVREGKIVIER